MDTEKFKGFTKFAANSIIATTIGVCWSQEDVFIVSTNYSKAYGDDTCSTELHNGLVRECDGDTAYFYMLASHVWAVAGDGEVQGADGIQEYGLTLTQFAKAAVYNQEQNGYGSPKPTDATKNILLGKGSPDAIDVSIPVCYLNEGSLKGIYSRDVKKRVGGPVPIPSSCSSHPEVVSADFHSLLFPFCSSPSILG